MLTQLIDESFPHIRTLLCSNLWRRINFICPTRKLILLPQNSGCVESFFPKLVLPALRAFVVLAITVGLGISHSEIVSGKTQFWKNLEDGKPQRYATMGSSMSANSQSFWPVILLDALRDQFGDLPVEFGGVDVARNGQSSTAAVEGRKGDGNGAMQHVIKGKADLVIMEFAWADARRRLTGMDVPTHKKNLRNMIFNFRAANPNMTIVIYETGRPDSEELNPMYPNYLAASKEIAEEMGTWFVPTFDQFQGIWDSLQAIGKAADYAQWAKEPGDHHPSVKAAKEIIVPAMLKALSGENTIRLPVINLGPLERKTYYQGEKISIQWSWDKTKISEIALELALDGKNFKPLIPSTKTIEKYDWLIPGTFFGKSTLSRKVKIRLRAADGSITQTSEVFRIEEGKDLPPLTLTMPFRETVSLGETLNITWDYDKNVIESLDVGLILPGNKVHALSTASVYGNSFKWIVPEKLNGENLIGKTVRIRVSEYGGQIQQISQPFVINRESTKLLNEIAKRNFSPSHKRKTPESNGFDIQGKKQQHKTNLKTFLIFPKEQQNESTVTFGPGGL